MQNLNWAQKLGKVLRLGQLRGLLAQGLVHCPSTHPVSIICLIIWFSVTNITASIQLVETVTAWKTNKKWCWVKFGWSVTKLNWSSIFVFSCPRLSRFHFCLPSWTINNPINVWNVRKNIKQPKQVGTDTSSTSTRRHSATPKERSASTASASASKVSRRSRSKSPFRSFRWKRGTSKAEVSDDEGGIKMSLYVTRLNFTGRVHFKLFLYVLCSC